MPDDFDILGGAEDRDLTAYMPASMPQVDYEPTPENYLFAMLRCSGLGIGAACKEGKISPEKYYGWRKDGSGFAMWLDAFIAEFRRTRALRMLDWVSTKGFDELKRIAMTATAAQRISAMRMVYEMGSTLSQAVAAEQRNENSPVVLDDKGSIVAMVTIREGRAKRLTGAETAIAGALEPIDAEVVDDDGD